MFKKTLLSTILTISTLTTAQIQLDLDVTITNQTVERHIVSTVFVDENIPTSFEFDNITLAFSVNTNDDAILINANILEKIIRNELVSISKPTIKTTWNKTATITIGNSNNDSLVFMITPSQA